MSNAVNKVMKGISCFDAMLLEICYFIIVLQRPSWYFELQKIWKVAYIRHTMHRTDCSCHSEKLGMWHTIKHWCENQKFSSGLWLKFHDFELLGFIYDLPRSSECGTPLIIDARIWNFLQASGRIFPILNSWVFLMISLDICSVDMNWIVHVHLSVWLYDSSCTSKSKDNRFF